MPWPNLWKMLGKCLEEGGVNLLEFAAAHEQVALKHNSGTRRRSTSHIFTFVSQ
jgi:hypothetical protein